MHALIVGSAEAYAGPGGIALSDGRHAVRTTDYQAICGAPVVFVFLDAPFTGTGQGTSLPHLPRSRPPSGSSLSGAGSLPGDPVEPLT